MAEVSGPISTYVLRTHGYEGLKGWRDIEAKSQYIHVALITKLRLS